MDRLEKNRLNDPQENRNEKNRKERRIFIKKTVYAAPTLIALGSLMKPTNAQAGGDTPPSGPPQPSPWA